MDDPAATAARPRAGWTLAGILAVAAVLRAAYLAEIAASPELAHPGQDAAFHQHWAKALWTGDWSPPQHFADPQIHTTPYFRPPGYPFLLALLHGLTGGDPLAIRGAQMLLGLLNVALTWRLGRALGGPAVAGVAAAGMAGTWTVVYFDGELLAPTLEIALFLAALLACLRWWRGGGLGAGIAAGLLLGLFAITRPNALALPPVVLAWAWWTSRRGVGSRRWTTMLLGLPLGAALAIAPVTLRNLAVAGDAVLISSNGGVNLHIGNNELADGHTARIPALGAYAPLQGWTCFDQPRIAAGVSRVVGRDLTASEVSRFFADRAFAFVAAEPGTALRLAATKAALFWGPFEVGNNREDELVRAHSALLRWLPTFPWLLSLAVVGAAMCWRDRRRATDAPAHAFVALLAGCVLVYFLSHLPFFVAGRYRQPLLPVLWLFAGLAIAGWWRRWREGRRRGAAAWAAVWLAALAGAHAPLTGYRPDAAQFHFERGDAWRMAGDLDRAQAGFERALAVATRPLPLAHNNLGATLLAKDDVPRAIAALRTACALAPDYAHARLNLGLALVRAGDGAGAIAELATAVSLDPELPRARAALGALLLRDGRATEALPHLAVATRLAPGDARSRHLQALALLDTGRGAEARAALVETTQRTPQYVEAYVTLAELAAGDGDRAGALRWLEQALARAPAHPGALALRRQLQ